MQQSESRVGGILAPGASGYEVPEGKGELANRNTVLLLIGQTVSLTGDGFYLQTVITWLTGILLVGATTAAASLAVAGIQVNLYIAYYLAGVLVIPFAGVFVDRWNRKTTMVVTNLVQTVLALIPLITFYAASRDTFLLTLYISYFLLTLAAGFFTAAELGAVQGIVSRRRVPQAISAFKFLAAVGTILGIFFAPSAFVAYGAVAAISFNALSFLVSAIFVFFMRAPKAAFHPAAFGQTSGSERTGVGTSLLRVFKDLGVGIRFVFTNRVLVALVIMLIVAEIGAGAANSLYSSFYLSNLHGTDIKLLGYLPAAIAGGLLIGSVVTGALALVLPLKFINTASVILAGVFLLLFAYQHNLAIAVAIYFVTGIFNGIFVVSYPALVTKLAPKTLIGRVQASIASAVSISAAIATFVIAGVVAGLAKSPTIKDPAALYTQIFTVSALLLVIGGIVGLVLVLKAREEPREVATAHSPVGATADGLAN
ncbi:MAG TPA: MFS transporter [Ktedonobacteraceae bacterium]|jgi:MFS family permease|nr:MFS transporter [Ktedonobacteraceae bacterium]